MGRGMVRIVTPYAAGMTTCTLLLPKSAFSRATPRVPETHGQTFAAMCAGIACQPGECEPISSPHSLPRSNKADAAAAFVACSPTAVGALRANGFESMPCTRVYLAVRSLTTARRLVVPTGTRRPAQRSPLVTQTSFVFHGGGRRRSVLLSHSCSGPYFETRVRIFMRSEAVMVTGAMFPRFSITLRAQLQGDVQECG